MEDRIRKALDDLDSFVDKNYQNNDLPELKEIRERTKSLRRKLNACIEELEERGRLASS